MKRLDTDEADDVGALSLYDRFAATIFDYLSQQLASRQDAEDLLVEIFLAPTRGQKQGGRSLSI